MARPTSFRLPDSLLERLDDAAAALGTSTTALVTSLLDEGMVTRRFPGVVYRDGPTGRRAALVGGPDIWEVVRLLREAPGKGDARLRAAAGQTGLSVPQLRLAIDFYAERPDEVDGRITADEREAERVRSAVQRREQLLSS